MKNLHFNLRDRKVVNIREIFKEGWSWVSGYKATFWGAFFLALFANIVILVFFSSLAYAAIHHFQFNKDHVDFVSTTLQTLIGLPLYVGFTLIGLKRVMGLTVNSFDIFHYYRHIWGLIGVYFLQMMIITLIAVLLFIAIIFIPLAQGILLKIVACCFAILFGLILIYLFVGYLFSQAIRVEKKTSLWQSLEISRQAITQNWFRVFFIMMVTVFLILVSAIPLLIGWIWVLPWLNTTIGVLYVRLFSPVNIDNIR